MVIKVNFGNSNSPLPDDGFILDSGAGYSEAQGFGWVTQDSLGNDAATPIDLAANTRDRNLSEDQRLDTFIHLQYPTELTGVRPEASIRTPSAWEYDLENGTYQITVGVGDAEFTDSTHVINAEGQSVISNFAPNDGQLFSENTAVVEVTDGKLTIDAVGGTNTKLNFIEIVPQGDGEADGTSEEGSPGSGNDSGNDTSQNNLVPSEDTTEEEAENTDGESGSDAPVDADSGTDSGADTPAETGEDGIGETPQDTSGSDDIAQEGAEDADGESGSDAPVDADSGTDSDADAPAETGEEGGGETPQDTSDSDDIAEEGAPLDSDLGGDGSDAPVDSVDGTPENTNTLTEAVKFNFGTPNVRGGGDATQDIGSAFSDNAGFGWVTEESAGSDNPVPLNLQGNTRERNSIEQDDLDSLIHLQFPEGASNANSVTTPGAWEYALADGEYTVTVAVGDPDFTDSNHVINIEGQSVISGFAPTESELFRVTTSVVNVSDGKLTIDAQGGTNTKLNFVEIAPSDVGVGDSPVDTTPIEVPTEVGIPVEGGGVVGTVEAVTGGVNVNFGAPSTGAPSGFIQDIGGAYNTEQGYGWVTQDSAGSDNLEPIDVVANGRDRDTLFNDGQGSLFEESTRDSLIHMQYPTGLPNSTASVTTPVAWEYDIVNGQYEVTVGVGDPDFFDSNHVINVEGEALISGFTPTGFEVNGSVPLGAQAFSEATAVVNVEDGRLTIDAIGGENTKINYVSISPVDGDA